MALLKANTGIGTTNPQAALHVFGNSIFTGIITAASFVGDGSALTGILTSGIATYASIAGVATYAQTAGIATSAGTATTATNLSNAANILTGTINKDRISTTNALTVLGDLYVSNNISFGGTATQLNAQQLQIVDADIVLGIGTSFSPTDNTANHGGIAIASTEGTPLVDLNIVPEETNPSTYKKIMWFKGSSIGVGITDAWLFNYAVGIGSTQVPNRVRFAAGSVQFTENDLAVIRNINATGIITASSFSGNASSATYATSAGVSTSVIGGIGSITQLSVSGVSTLGVSTFTGAVSFGTSAYFGDNDKLYFGDGNDLQIYHDGSDSRIDNSGPNNLYVTSNNNLFFQNANRASLYLYGNKGVELYYNVDGTLKLETIGAGVTVTGTTFTNQLSVSDGVNVSGVVTATAFVGDGSQLTNLPGGSGAAASIDLLEVMLFS